MSRPEPPLDRAYRRRSPLHRRTRADKRKLQLLYILETSDTAQARAKAAKLRIEIEPEGNLSGSWEILRKRTEQAIHKKESTIEIEVLNALALLVTHKEALRRKVLPQDERTAALVISAAADEIEREAYGKKGVRARIEQQAIDRLIGIRPRRGLRTVKDLIGRELARRLIDRELAASRKRDPKH
jgi:hypothetical protein